MRGPQNFSAEQSLFRVNRRQSMNGCFPSESKAGHQRQYDIELLLFCDRMAHREIALHALHPSSFVFCNS